MRAESPVVTEALLDNKYLTLMFLDCNSLMVFGDKRTDFLH
jgi:hypothetical protein